MIKREKQNIQDTEYTRLQFVEKEKKKGKNICQGVPAVMKWDQQHLGSVGTQVRTPG